MASLVIDAIDSMTIAAISAIEGMANKVSGDLRHGNYWTDGPLTQLRKA